jgi:monooxygenase
VLIVGAGLSGIAAGYHVQATLPHARYAVLEAREAIGGTWDLFRYPGVRSDSDMYTLGYSFYPWTSDRALADGPSILAYVRETAARFGIDRHIRFQHRVERVSWSSADARWTVHGTRGASATPFAIRCRFLMGCTGYYRYDAGFTPDLPGLGEFAGTVLHPQQWPADFDPAGKRIVVIGSGATAITLVPALAARGAHVTMLQRSPTYIISRPAVDQTARRLRRVMPAAAAHAAIRWRNIGLNNALYEFCRAFPAAARRLLERSPRTLAPSVDADKHFSPSYAPWDQRLCLVPDGDLFHALARGDAEIVTDHIERVTPTGLALRSGRSLPADVIVTATGLRLQFFGGATLVVDGAVVEPRATHLYKGTLLSGIPNFAVILGYTNISWTLKCELAVQYACRLIAHLDAHGQRAVIADPAKVVGDEPLIDLQSGYVRRADALFPRQGSASPWRMHQNYVRDLAMMRRGKLDDGVVRFA